MSTSCEYMYSTCAAMSSLVSEAIACSIIAGVGPKVGLYASVCIAKRSLARLK